MSELIQLKAVIEIDDADFQRGLRRDEEGLQAVTKEADRASGSIGGLAGALQRVDGSRLKDVGQKLTLGVTLPLAAMGAGAIKAASDTDESLSKVNVVFGKNAKEIETWSQSAAKNFGQSRQGALEAAGTFGNLFTSMEIGQPKAAAMSQTLVQLAGDLGSFNNVNPEEAIVALRAGLVGESEPLRRFGVNLSEAKIQAEALRLGLIANTKDALGPAAKAQAAYSLILKETKNAQGDYLRTSDGLANTMRTLKAEVGDAAAEFGKELIPAVKDGVKFGRELLGIYKQLPDGVKKMALPIALGAAAVGPALSTVGSAVTIGQALMGGGAAAAGGGALASGGALAGASALALPVAAGVAAVGTGLAVGYAIDQNTGGRERDQRVRQSNGALDAAQKFNESNSSDAQNERRRQAGLPYFDKSGRLIRPAAPPAAAGGGGGLRAAGPAGSPEELQKAADAEFAAKLAAVKAQTAAGSQETNAQREAAALVPVLQARAAELTKRAQELKPKISESANNAAEYYKLEKEASDLQAQSADLRTKAAKEAADNQKKAAEKARAAQREQFQLHNQALDNYVLAARAQQASRGEGEDGDPNLRAMRENELMRPVLEAKQQGIRGQVQALLATKQNDPETVREYNQLVQEYWQAEYDKNNLAARAAAAEKASQKKAGQEVTKAFHAQLQIAKDQAVARAADAAPGNEARALATELAPVLEAAQDALVADLKNYKVGSEDYWKAVGEIEKSKREIAQLDQRAAKEAASEQQKAVANAHKAAQERRGLMSAEAQLAELQLKNNPLLSQRQRTQAMIPLLLQQYREAMRPIQGETRVESVQRQISAEQLRGQMLDSLKNLGIGRRGMMVAMGQLNAVAAQGQADPYLARAATADARQVASSAASGRPMVFQIVLDPHASPQQQYAQYQEMTRRASREAGYLGPAGG